MASIEQKTTALGDACTSAAVACDALERVRRSMVAAGVSTAAVDALLADAQRLASGLGDAYIASLA